MGEVVSKVEKIQEFVKLDRINSKETLKDGTTVSYSYYGPSTGFVVVMIPGIGGNRFMINNLEPHVIGKDVRLVFLDFPGYGNSSYQKNRSLKQFCDVFVEFISLILQNNTSKFGLVGNSCGGIHISALLTDKRIRHRIVAAGILAPWVPLTTPEMKFTSRILTKLPTVLVRQIAKVIYYTNRFGLRNFKFKTIFKRMVTKDCYDTVLKHWKLDEDAWNIFLKYHFVATNVSGFTESFLLCCEAVHKIDIDLNEIDKNCKVQVYYGTKDDMLPVRAVEAYYRNRLKPEVLSKNFQFFKIENGTHDSVPLMEVGKAIKHILDHGLSTKAEVPVVVA